MEFKRSTLSTLIEAMEVRLPSDESPCDSMASILSTEAICAAAVPLRAKEVGIVFVETGRASVIVAAIYGHRQAAPPLTNFAAVTF